MNSNDPKRKRKAQSNKRKTKGVKENRQDRITLDKAERARLDQIISEYEQQNHHRNWRIAAWDQQGGSKRSAIWFSKHRRSIPRSYFKATAAGLVKGCRSRQALSNSKIDKEHEVSTSRSQDKTGSAGIQSEHAETIKHRKEAKWQSIPSGNGKHKQISRK